MGAKLQIFNEIMAILFRFYCYLSMISDILPSENRRVERRTRLCGRTAHQQLHTFRLHHNRTLQGAVGNRDILPQPQAATAHQEFHRHFPQRRGDANKDGTGHDAAFLLAQTHSTLQMGARQSRRVLAA